MKYQTNLTQSELDAWLASLREIEPPPQRWNWYTGVPLEKIPYLTYMQIE